MNPIKKVLSVLLCLVLAVGAGPFCGIAASRVGDADADGVITAADARLVLRAAVGLDAPKEPSVLDVDGDLSVTSSDARLVLRYSVGLETRFPVASAPAPASVTASPNAACAMLYDATANAVLFRKNSTKRTAPASLAKLLTAITALQNCPESEVFPVGDEIDLIGYNSSVCYLQKGWNASLKTLLTGMLTSSGNDAAYCIAVNVARRQEPGISDQTALQRFVALMNRTAARLGMQNSRFVNPDGYDADGQYTTAEDLLLLAKATLGYPTIRKICAGYCNTAYLASGGAVTWYNTNRMLNPDDVFYRPTVTGLKTGSTDAAGCCVIVSFLHGDRLMIAVVLEAPSDADRYEAVAALMDAL